MKEKKYTIQNIVDAVEEERRKTFTLLNYILNKNSHPLPRGVDYKKAYEDMQELEDYLLDSLKN